MSEGSRVEGKMPLLWHGCKDKKKKKTISALQLPCALDVFLRLPSLRCQDQRATSYKDRPACLFPSLHSCCLLIEQGNINTPTTVLHAAYPKSAKVYVPETSCRCRLARERMEEYFTISFAHYLPSSSMGSDAVLYQATCNERNLTAVCCFGRYPGDSIE